MTRQPRVVVTRPQDASEDLMDRLEALGFEVVHVPAIEIGPPRAPLRRRRWVTQPGSHILEKACHISVNIV